MRTVKLTLQYDGTEYVGWQRQDTGESVQGVIEDALARIEGQAVTLHAAGRTDAGVHATGQVASVRLTCGHDDETLARALNANLPPAVRVSRAETVADEFHARFSAHGKTYEYRIWNGPVVAPFLRLYTWHVPQALHLGRLQAGADAIVGPHDFAAFRGSRSVVHSTVRTITSAVWHPPDPDGVLVFEIAGEGFLRYMVRSLVGTLVEAGLGRRPAEDMAGLLARPDRAQAGRTAPPQGLFLTKVTY